MENIQSVKWNYDLITNTKCSYQVTLIDETIMSVPLDEANSDYIAIQEWVENGGVIVDNGA